MYLAIKIVCRVKTNYKKGSANYGISFSKSNRRENVVNLVPKITINFHFIGKLFVLLE